MIPTLLIVGLVLGKWWRVVLPTATVGWLVLLMATGTGSGLDFAAVAALFAVANLAVGALVFQAVRLLWHRVVSRHPASG